MKDRISLEQQRESEKFWKLINSTMDENIGKTWKTPRLVDYLRQTHASATKDYKRIQNKLEIAVRVASNIEEVIDEIEKPLSQIGVKFTDSFGNYDFNCHDDPVVSKLFKLYRNYFKGVNSDNNPSEESRSKWYNLSSKVYAFSEEMLTKMNERTVTEKEYNMILNDTHPFLKDIYEKEKNQIKIDVEREKNLATSIANQSARLNELASLTKKRTFKEIIRDYIPFIGH